MEPNVTPVVLSSNVMETQPHAFNLCSPHNPLAEIMKAHAPPSRGLFLCGSAMKLRSSAGDTFALAPF